MKPLRAFAMTCIAMLFGAATAAAAVTVADIVDTDGHLAGTPVRVDPLTPLAAPATRTLAARPRASVGDHTIAVIPMRFGSAPTGFTVAQLRDAVFGSGDSVSTFYRESTYGRVRLGGRVFPIVSIPAPADGCSFSAYSTAAISALRAAGEPISGDGRDGYDHYLFVFSRRAECRWVGLATVPGRYMWINGYVDRAVLAHEFGHNLGLGHANALTCRDARNAPTSVSSNCTEREYGDPYEVMGARGRQLSSASRELIGVLDASEYMVITSDATVTLRSSSVAGAGVKVIEIPRPGTSGTWFVGMRSTAGYDAFPKTSNVTAGVLIRLRAEDSTLMTPTQLIDATPKTPTLNDAAFLPGRSFHDPAGNVTITVLARTGNSARVRVAFSASAQPVQVTSSPSVGERWPSRVALYRRPDGRVRVDVRQATAAGPRCSYRMRGLSLVTGRCTTLTPLHGWKAVGTVPACDRIVIALLVPGGDGSAGITVRAPRRKGHYLIYRIG